MFQRADACDEVTGVLVPEHEVSKLLQRPFKSSQLVSSMFAPRTGIVIDVVGCRRARDSSK